MKNSGTIIIIIIVAIVAMMAIGSYNGLVSQHEKVESSLADLDVMIQRRADLIPNLINVVKGYAAHENDAIDKVTASREKLVNANTVAEKAEADQELTNSLKSVFAIAESYPDLKASQNYIQLSDELAGSENRIAVSRKDYNDAVKSYNTSIKKFPTAMFASMFGFEKADYFEASEGSDVVPTVEF